MPKATPTKASARVKASPASKRPKATGAMTYASFNEAAKPLLLTIRPSIGEPFELQATAKEFSSRSFGWSASSNAKIPLDGSDSVDVTLLAEIERQTDREISMNFTVKGSKPKDVVVRYEDKPPTGPGTKGGSKRSAKTMPGHK